MDSGPALHVCLLGELELVYQDARLREINTPRLQSLLAFLVLHHSQRFGRARLAAMYWPDSPENQARTNLRNLLHQLRRALPDADRFLFDDQKLIAWRAEAAFSLDVLQFEQAAARAKAAQQAGEIEAARLAWSEAAGLYQSDLLPGCYDDWILPERERLRQIFLEVLHCQAGDQQEQGEFAAAIQTTQRILREDPLREDTYRNLMNLHALSGDRAGVYRVYQTCVSALKTGLGVLPSALTRETYKALVKAPPEEPAPAAPKPPRTESEPPQRHNLPVELTAFIGRRRELGELQKTLERARLLTLTGPAGVGKTRLALHFAWQMQGANQEPGDLLYFPHGVWWIGLAPLSDPDQLLQAASWALGLQDQPAQNAVQALEVHLRTRGLLLVLDNCEHLLRDSSSLVYRLLTACSQLRVLATSREPLGVPGEVTWMVPNLSLPEPVQNSSELSVRQMIGEAEAVQLFVEHAKAVLPTFQLTEQNASSIAQICRRLDGIPLAIELAAARVRMMTVEQVAARLDDALRLLQRSWKGELAHHQTLRAAIDWSYQLLAPAERQFLCRLAVFAGSFTLEALEDIQGGQSPESSWDILEILTRLVDKSLVVPRLEEHSGARYQLLEIVRQYAQEKLAALPDLSNAQERYRQWYYRLADQARAEAAGPQQGVWVQRLRAEQENLRAALELTLQADDSEAGLDFVLALFWFWSYNGAFDEARAAFQAALNGAAAGLPSLKRAEALYTLGKIVRRQGDLDRALCYYQESLELYRRWEARPAIADVLASLSVVHTIRADYAAAVDLIARCLEIARELQDRQRISMALNISGELARLQGAYSQARALFEECLALGFAASRPFVLHNLAHVVSRLGQHHEAAVLFLESMQLWQERGNQIGWVEALAGLAGILAAQGRFDPAARLLGAVDAALPTGSSVLDSADQQALGKTREIVRLGMDKEAFENAYQAGRSLPLEDAAAFAKRTCTQD